MNGDLKRAKDIFITLLQVPHEQWTDRLDTLCEGDSVLRQQLEELLAAHLDASSFLDRPAIDLNATDVRSELSSKVGTTIGPYKLLQQIGEGGFGVVFMAEQMTPVKRKVALKIIKPGMDSREVIARFEAERQALAMMDHPNIAKVLDAGSTPDGRPFFVMDLVTGVPITEYCDRNQLTNPERLRLFVYVCNAVQHAHHNGIIHRDLKPSNILVTLHDGRPVPKVIDFGVAKALSGQLTEKTLFTAYGQMVGTPIYMSPEQAEMSGLDVDMRSDVYSLGVLLYELLTGTTPFSAESLREAALAELQRIIREETPHLPSVRIGTLGQNATVLAEHRQTDSRRLSHDLRGELDWIVMKTLEKDRDRRYESPTILAAEIERFLKGETITACPPSIPYTVHKFVRKHRLAFVTGSLMAASLLAGLGISLWQAAQAREAAHRAQLHEQRAEQNFELAREAVDQLLTSVAEEQMMLEPQHDNIRRELINSAWKFYTELSTHDHENDAIKTESDRALRKLESIKSQLSDPDDK